MRKQRQAVLTVAGVGIGLGCDRADTGASVRHHGADGEKAARDRHSDLAGLGVGGDDRKSRRYRPSGEGWRDGEKGGDGEDDVLGGKQRHTPQIDCNVIGDGLLFTFPKTVFAVGYRPGRPLESSERSRE